MKQSIPDAVKSLLREYRGGSMDPTYFAIINMVHTELIGEDEITKDTENNNTREMEIRNIFRKKQRELLHSTEDDSLKLPIALVLDDYRIAVTTPEDDQIVKPMSLERAAELIIAATESYLLPKGREVVMAKNKPEIEIALAPLFKAQLEALGAI